MGIRYPVPITRSGLPCLPPPPAPRKKYPWGAPHRAVPSTAAVYRRRQPERTLLYRTVQTHLGTWLALQDEGAGETAPAVTEREFRRYLEYGILAHGFARARCADCGHDFLVAYSCKCRGVCPSCTTLGMPQHPGRQTLITTCAFGSNLSSGPVPAYGHFHCIVIDGVFEADAQDGVTFHPESGVDAPAIAAVQAAVRKRLLRAALRRGLLSADDAQTMANWEHGGGASSMPRYASRRMSATVWNGCCATAPVRPLRWSAYVKSIPSIWSTRA